MARPGCQENIVMFSWHVILPYLRETVLLKQ
jgi:hypothetical protein